MFLKKLLLFIGFISIIHAQPLNNKNVHFSIQEENKNTYIIFNSSLEGKTWIGIYKKNTSNEWKNVQKWEWVTKPTTKISIASLDAGDYEARLFFNNSFITEKVISFHMGEGPFKRLNRLKDTTIKISESSRFTLKDVYYEDEPLNWVGVFKFGSKHNRDNLLAWGYLEKGNRVTIKTINGKELPLANYDLAYFFKNSYNQLGDTKILTVKDSLHDIDHGEFRGIYGGKDVLMIHRYNSFKKENDWVAIFEINAEPIKENILRWAYVKDGIVMSEKKSGTMAIYFPTFPKNMNDGFCLLYTSPSPRD